MATLALIAAGGAAASWFADRGTPTVRASLPPTAGGQAPWSASPAAGARPPSPAVSAPHAPGGSDTVIIAPTAGREPHARRIAVLLMKYFAAINGHNAGAYASLFIPALRAGLRHLSSGYRSTVDSAETLTGLFVTGPLGLAATVTFTSHQSPADSPDQAACDKWDITLFLKHTSSGYRIRRPRPGFPDTVQPCS